MKLSYGYGPQLAMPSMITVCSKPTMPMRSSIILALQTLIVSILIVKYFGYLVLADNEPEWSSLERKH